MSTVFMPRSAWTTAARGGAQLTGTKLLGLACHWPGTTTDGYGVESADRVASRLRGWWDYHVNTRGWTDIGYNFAVDQAGRAWDLRGLVRVGAHAASSSNPDANHEWVGVLFILGDREQPTGAMVRAFQDLRFLVFLPRWPGRMSLTGHGRAPGVPGAQTSCPGPFVAAKLTDGTLGQRPTTSTDWLEMATQAEVEQAFRNVLAEKVITLEWDGGPPNAQKVSIYEALSYIHFNAADASFVGEVPETSSRASHRGRDTYATQVLDGLDAITPPGEGDPDPLA